MSQYWPKQAFQVIALFTESLWSYTRPQTSMSQNDRRRGNLPVPEPRGAGRAMRIQQLATSVKMSGLRHAAGPRTRRM